MNEKQVNAFIELNAGKLDDSLIISRALENGMEGKAAQRKLSEVKQAKLKTAGVIFWIGILAFVIGIMVSVIASNSRHYEYFYWWGLVLAGIIMTISGLLFRRKFK